jgi:hypothetical protein
MSERYFRASTDGRRAVRIDRMASGGWRVEKIRWSTVGLDWVIDDSRCSSTLTEAQLIADRYLHDGEKNGL